MQDAAGWHDRRTRVESGGAKTLHVGLGCYEWPDVTDNCGGGGAVAQRLRATLIDRDHLVSRFTDDSDGHFATFPARQYRRAGRWLRRTDPDVVHACFSLPTALPLARHCARRDIPLVVTCMGADVYDPTRFGLVRPLADRANRYVFKRADRVIVPSTDMHDRVRERYGIDAAVIPYGINPSEFSWQPRQLHDPVDIVSVCRLVERKRLHTAIDAVEQLRQQGTPARYRIVGTGPLAGELADRAADRDWLTVAGYVDTIADAYADADLFYLPSRHEAFGMVFLEALASGLPVVTSATGGQTDVVCEGVGRCADLSGLASTHSKALFLAGALREVIDAYPQYQAATRGYVEEHYHEKRMAHAYEQVYREVLV